VLNPFAGQGSNDTPKLPQEKKKIPPVFFPNAQVPARHPRRPSRNKEQPRVVRRCRRYIPLAPPQAANAKFVNAPSAHSEPPAHLQEASRYHEKARRPIRDAGAIKTPAMLASARRSWIHKPPKESKTDPGANISEQLIGPKG